MRCRATFQKIMTPQRYRDTSFTHELTVNDAQARDLATLAFTDGKIEDAAARHAERYWSRDDRRPRYFGCLREMTHSML